MVIEEELLYTVDEHNEPIEPASRKLSHQQWIWHRTCQIWVINDKHQVLCQRRSLLKDMNPGKWEAIFGGHMAPKQEYIDCAVGELQEELGIAVKKDDLHFLFVNKSEKDTEFQGIFYVKWNGDSVSLQLEKEEVEEVMWIPMKDLKNVFTRKDANWSNFGYEMKVLRDLQNSEPSADRVGGFLAPFESELQLPSVFFFLVSDIRKYGFFIYSDGRDEKYPRDQIPPLPQIAFCIKPYFALNVLALWDFMN